MHNLAKKIADCLKAKVEAMGIDNIRDADLDEFGKWVDIIKDIACYDKDMRIIDAMDEAEDSHESIKYIEAYEDYPEMRKGYRGQPRDRMGRYMSRGRRGYEDWHDMQHMRDMDRDDMSRMYYSGDMAMDGMHDMKEGKSGAARKGYMESKEMHKMNTPEDKQHKMRELEHYMQELGADITDMINDASSEEKNLLKTKLQMLATKIQ